MFKSLFFIIGFFMASNVFANTRANFAYVDLQLAMDSVRDGTKAIAKLEKEFKEKQKILKAREEEIKKLSAEYEKKALVMSNQKKMKAQQEVQRKMLEYRELMQQSEMAMQRRRMELTRPIIESMRSVIETIAEKSKYDLVYEKNQSGIFFAKGAKNITNDLIKKYNEIHK